MLDPGQSAAKDPEEAAAQLIALLDDLPSFDPCRGPAEEWDTDVRNRRLPIWDLLPDHLRSLPSKVMKSSWWAFGGGLVIQAAFPELRTSICVAPGSKSAEKQPAVQRVLAARASQVPDFVHSTILSAWRHHPAATTAEPEVILRNDWHERRSLVAGVQDDLAKLVPLAARAVARAKHDNAPVLALLKSELLDTDVVDAAIANLRPAVPQRRDSHGSDTPKDVQAPPGRGRPINTFDFRKPEPLASASLPQPTSAHAGNRFAKTGEYWSVAFHGASATMRDTKGMGYLGQLLKSPGSPLHTWVLRHGESPPDEAGRDDLLDAETMQEVRGRVTDLTSLLESERDPELREKARAELERSRDYLKSGTRISGGRRKSRSNRGDLEKTRETVAQAITTALKKISVALPSLHKHLQESLHGPNSLIPCYRPATGLDWQVDM